MNRQWKAVLAVACLVGTAFLTGAASGPTRVRVDELGQKFVLIGKLDQRFGTFMTVEGVADREWMGTGRPIAVDTVDGKKLAKPITVGAVGAPKLTKGVRYVLRGYENCGMQGTPVDPKGDANASAVQQPMGFRTWFEVTKVESLADMKQDGK